MEFEFFGLKFSKTRKLTKGERFFIVISFGYFFFVAIRLINSFEKVSIIRKEACSAELASTIDGITLSRECITDLFSSVKNYQLALEQIHLLLHAITFYLLVVILLKITQWLFK